MEKTRNIILIVDDDARNIFALTAVLKAKGYLCQSASDAEEALNLLSKNAGIGIVLLDMMMPEKDGYELLTILRDSPHAHTPVVAVTAQAMVGDRERCLAAGADEYVSKPIDVDKLVAILDKYL